MRTLALSLLFVSVSLAVGQTPPAAKPVVPKKEAIEDDIAKALRTHPDILVAEAEAQLANAKLQQTRQLVAQKVSAAKREIEKAKSELTSAMKISEATAAAHNSIVVQHQTMKQLGNQVSRAELQKIEAAFAHSQVIVLEQEQKREASKVRLMNLQAEYDAMVGNTIASADGRVFTEYSLTDNSIRSRRLPLFDVQIEKYPASGVKAGSFGEQLLAALDKPVKLDAMKNVDIQTAYSTLLKTANVQGLIRTLSMEDPAMFVSVTRIGMPAGEHTLRTWLTLMGDVINNQLLSDLPAARNKRYELYVREYGLLVTTIDFAPSDAITVNEFAKRYQPKQTPPAK